MTKETKAIEKQETKVEQRTVPIAAVRAQLHNDWSKVSEEDRLRYVVGICQALDIPTVLNPFKFIEMKGKTVLYAPNEAAQLLAERNKISAQIISKTLDPESNIYTVEVRASMPNGRSIDNMGCLYLGGLTGEARANAMMKTVTKAMRRTIFNAVGLSIMDEDEMGTNVPPTSLPIPQILAPKKSLSEDEQARLEFLQQLIGKGGKFEKQVGEAKAWILETCAIPFEKLSAQDCQDLAAALNGNGDDDLAQATPVEEIPFGDAK